MVIPSSIRSQRGSALIAVLWISTLIAVLIGSAAYLSRVEVRYASGHFARAKLTAAIEGGIQLSISQLLSNLRSNRSDSATKKTSYIVGDTAVHVTIENEAGKIDINYAPPELLQALLSYHGVSNERAQKISAAIADWRDPDNLERIGGAESSAYQAAGLNYRPANTLFRYPFELQQVLGIPSSLFQKLEPFITTHAANRGVDLNLASKEMLTFFSGGDEDLVTEHFKSGPKGAGARNNIARLVKPQMLRYNSRARRQVYSIQASAKSAQHTKRKTVIVEVVNRSGRRFKFL